MSPTRALKPWSLGARTCSDPKALGVPLMLDQRDVTSVFSQGGLSAQTSPTGPVEVLGLPALPETSCPSVCPVQMPTAHRVCAETHSGIRTDPAPVSIHVLIVSLDVQERFCVGGARGEEGALVPGGRS